MINSNEKLCQKTITTDFCMKHLKYITHNKNIFLRNIKKTCVSRNISPIFDNKPTFLFTCESCDN